MKTPIYDFARGYAERRVLRAHMPGHKGNARLGVEELDITELDGADSLYDASGIIRESEANASSLFGAHTLYSTEGSSLSIRAMVAIVRKYSEKKQLNPLILAARNAHKSFIYATALAGVGVEWLYGEDYLSFEINGERLAETLDKTRPAAVYITSPDYLGREADVAKIAEICHARDTLLLVDNAHGAYLKFLSKSRHPIDLGADMCCDSAHKTLPVLTGGGYLHISKAAPCELLSYARGAMELFASTSPSYLILESLDLANRELYEGYAERISQFAKTLKKYTERLKAAGYRLSSDEPFKITLNAKEYGYPGTELGGLLQKKGVVPEFYDPDYLVLMLTPDTEEEGVSEMVDALLGIQKREKISEQPPKPTRLVCAMSARDAIFSPAEWIPVSNSVGRILASASVGCPPAVPLAVSGEIIDENTASAFKYYGIEKVNVIKCK